MRSSDAARAEPQRVEIRAGERLVLVDGEPARIGARAFDVLRALFERRDRLVTKSELFDIVWPGVVVEENNLQVQISALRKLLGPHAIATIPGRGYRLTGVVTDAPSAAASDSPGDRGSATAEAPRRSATLTNLPAERATLYGRDADLAAVRALVDAHRLVTIVGSAGIGKTALAVAVAQDLRVAFADGAWLVDLAPITDPALVLPTVSAVLGARFDAKSNAGSLADALRDAAMLLVLDNCEHLLVAVAEIAQALHHRASGVRVLATSQEPLRLMGEQIYRLDTLALPDGDDLASARDAGALSLFEARARAADPRFALNKDNVAAVIDICRHLDGVALAIELAAARAPVLGVDILHARLDERFRILTAGHRLALRRHQTLRAALEWSHGLLASDEQAIFRRLGVFVGSFDLESAQYVAADGRLDEWAVLDRLMALVDKSLVMALEGPNPRYRLLESGRALALEKLQEAGETDATMERHLQTMRNLFEKAVAGRWSLPRQILYDRYLGDLDNARAALDWAAREDAPAEPMVALMGACSELWDLSRPEMLRRSRLAISRMDPTTPRHFANRLLLEYALKTHTSTTAFDLDAVERSVALSRELGDPQSLFLGLGLLMFKLTRLGRLAEADRAAAEAESLHRPDWPPALLPQFLMYRAHLHEAHGRTEQAWDDKMATMHAYRRMGDAVRESVAMCNVADFALIRGDVPEAIRVGREVVSILRADPQNFRVRGGIAMANLCAALTRGGQLEEARAMARDAIPLLRWEARFDDFVDHFALLAFREARVSEAALLLGRSEAVFAETGGAREQNEQQSHDQVQEGLRQVLPGHELERLLREGAGLTEEAAAAVAAGP